MNRFALRNDIMSWGRVQKGAHYVASPLWREDLHVLCRQAVQRDQSLLATGLRRSYGDSNLNPGNALIDMTALDRLIAFDPQSRLIRAEAGLSLHALLPIILRAGFFLPVTPGTRYVTLGGAVANDVHGKNHHKAGTFGNWVRRLGLLRSDGTEIELDSSDTSGLFAATIGGLGLTGIISWIEFELLPIESTEMEVETIAFGDLDEFFHIAAESDSFFDYTVSWIDCAAGGKGLGRGLFSRARHSTVGSCRAKKNTTRVTMPFDLPEIVLNPWSVRAFNALYYCSRKRRPTKAVVGYQSFFYPLDAIGAWNRIYGRRGMYQYQSVIPPDAAPDATKAMLRAIGTAGEGSFLAVLKTFGDKASPGLLSFPRSGTTLALDFPNRGASTHRLMERLDAIVQEAGGRLYPAKDGRIPAAVFRQGYPEWETFGRYVDPHFASLFWTRVGS